MVIFLCVGWISCANSKIYWKCLTAGIEYTAVNPSYSQSIEKIYAFKIDLNRYNFQIIRAKDLKQTSLFANQWTQPHKVFIAINGGFFTPTLHPIGLRISNGETLSPLRPIKWWGIFLIKNNQAQIVSPKNYSPSPQINFAIQATPRLIIDGQILKLQERLAQRSSLCITKSGKVIIAITDLNLLLTPTQLAILLKKLDCYNALNLDGGNSSQLFARINDFSLNVPSLRPVADLILVSQVNLFSLKKQPNN